MGNKHLINNLLNDEWMVNVPTMKLFHTILVTTKFLASDIT